VYSDVNGNYSFSNVVVGIHTVEVDLTGSDYYGTSTPSSYTVDTNNNSFLFNFGLLNDDPFYNVSLSGSVYYWWEYYVSCNLTYTRYYYVQNNGNTTIDPVLTVNFDDQLSLAYTFPDYTSAGAGTVEFVLDPLVPGTSVWVSVVFDPPGVELAGESLTFTSTVDVYDNGEYIETQMQNSTSYVWCSYDPTAKLAYPVGYTDEHFITNETELDYIITFQNTGSAIAQNITLLDTLDVSLDLSTFELIENSHEVVVSIDQTTRELFFIFSEINLPDSSSNEAASHGHIIYRISPMNNLEVATVIENTAHIFFDSNPAIITNTVFHTVFSCDGLADFVLSDDEVCEGEIITATSSQQFVDGHEWMLNSTVAGNSATVEFEMTEPGTTTISLIATNQICEEQNSLVVEVLPFSQSSFEISFGLDDNWLLTANNGTGWQWFFENEPIEGATSQVYSTDIQGSYSVITYDESGCNEISDDVQVYPGVEELMDAFHIYPNPASDVVYFSHKVPSVSLHDGTGRMVQTCFNCASLDCSSLARGFYTMKIGETRMKLILQ